MATQNRLFFKTHHCQYFCLSNTISYSLFLFVNRLRAKEMNATEKWADELTKQAAGKHHIGDFLPPEELRK